MKKDKSKSKVAEPVKLETKPVPVPVPADDVTKQLALHDLHSHDQGKELHSESLRAEQELKTRESMQRDHNMFPKGLASDHSKGKSGKR